MDYILLCQPDDHVKMYTFAIYVVRLSTLSN